MFRYQGFRAKVSQEITPQTFYDLLLAAERNRLQPYFIKKSDLRISLIGDDHKKKNPDSPPFYNFFYYGKGGRDDYGRLNLCLFSIDAMDIKSIIDYKKTNPFRYKWMNRLFRKSPSGFVKGIPYTVLLCSLNNIHAYLDFAKKHVTGLVAVQTIEHLELLLSTEGSEE